jgi:hypothetical protein
MSSSHCFTGDTRATDRGKSIGDMVGGYCDRAIIKVSYRALSTRPTSEFQWMHRFLFWFAKATVRVTAVALHYVHYNIDSLLERFASNIVASSLL